MPFNIMKITNEHLQRIKSRAKSARILAPTTNQGADLSQWCGSVFNQEQEGSCADCTTRDYLLWLQNKYGYNPVTDPAVNGIYYFARLMSGDLNSDGGSTIHDAFQASITYGVIPSSDDTYSESTLYTEPPLNDVAFQASAVVDLDPTTTTLRASLDSGVPVGIGVEVMDTLFSPIVYNGMHIVDVGTIQPNEGHGIFAVAYKPDPKYTYLYKFQNSWDVTYGDDGFAWFTEAYLQQCLAEACTLDIPKVKTAPVPANVVLQVGTDKASYTVGDSASVWVTLEDNGQTIIGQYVNLSISDGNNGSIPILADGKNGIPWSPASAGTYTITATWGNLTETATVTVSAAQPTPVPTPTPAPAKTTYANGGDVSKFQGTITWANVAKSWSFALIKALDGKTPVDANFETNYAGAKNAGILRSPYQVGYPALGDTAADSFAALESVVQAQGGYDLPPCLDIEATGCGTLDKTTITTWVNAWIAAARASDGRAPIIYSNLDFFETNLDLTQIPSDVLIWVASYNSNAPILPGGRKWTFWQHTDAATVSGISDKVDTDYFAGTKGELSALATKSNAVTAAPMQAQVNGALVNAYDIGGVTFVEWSAIPGVKDTKVNGIWNFVTPAGTDEKPVSVTAIYADGSTQTFK